MSRLYGTSKVGLFETQCRWGAYWPHLANTILPCVCGSDEPYVKLL